MNFNNKIIISGKISFVGQTNKCVDTVLEQCIVCRNDSLSIDGSKTDFTITLKYINVCTTWIGFWKSRAYNDFVPKKNQKKSNGSCSDWIIIILLIR